MADVTIASAAGMTERFATMLAALSGPTVLELGTLRWQGDLPTHHRAWAPDACTYVMADIAPGTDVDIVADAHDLAPFADECFDVVIAASVWEHLARPWLAAQAVARVLRPGGLAYIATHQSFPLHGYPSDYTRWSSHGLTVLFEDAGLVVIEVGYAYPCKIIPPAEVTRWNPEAEAYLNVAGIWQKP